MKFVQVIAVFSALIAISHARVGFGPTDQEWGFVEVRPGAHMFWWLQQTTANVSSYTDRPLVIWLQGGPGASSTGYGNFAELGPLDVNLEARDFAWTNDVNVLFVDNPVGAGFSYTTNQNLLTTTNREIAEDFLQLMLGFYDTLPAYLDTPLYIFCESYGGKMTAEIALVLDQAINAGRLRVNLLGVGLGDSWIAPIDITLTWAPYLYSLGFIDKAGYDTIQNAANQSKIAYDNGNFALSTNLWVTTEYALLRVTSNVDFYNVLKRIRLGNGQKNNKIDSRVFRPAAEDDDDDEDRKIEEIMLTKVAPALGITNVRWGAQSGQVFNRLSVDFMKPVTHIVEELLNTTDIKVAVYNGQLDLIVDDLGTIKWVDELRFYGTHLWPTAPRNPVVANGIVEGYYKKTGNLAMYWINRAGHMVPADNPAGMDYILRDVTDNYSGRPRT